MSATATPRSNPTRLARRFPYLPGIDGLRAISVLAVLAYHGGVRWVPGGFLGVEVFFVISGYLITSLLVDEYRRTNRISLRGFWSRRARRLLPALGVLLLGCIAIGYAIAPDALVRLRVDVPAAVFYVSNWAQILHQDSYFVAAGRPPLLAHLWSLAVEEQFYLVIPVLAAALLPRLRRRALAVLAVLAAVVSAGLMALWWSDQTDPSRLYLATHTRLSGLFLGVALGLVWSATSLHRPHRTPIARSARVALDSLGAAGAVVLAWAFWRVNEFDAFVYRGGFVVVDLATLALILCLTHPDTRLTRLVGHRSLRWIGQRSYGLYLWHWPVFQLTRPGIDQLWPGWLTTIVRVGLTFGLTAASYRWIEQPLRHLPRPAPWSVAPVYRKRRLATALAVMTVVGVILAIGPTVRPDRSSAAREAAALQQAAAADQQLTIQDLTGTPTAPPGSDPATTAPAGGDTPTTAPAAPTDPSVPAPAPTTTGPPTTLSPANFRVTAVGDSVMLGAKQALQRTIPQLAVDAQVSRQFGAAAGRLVQLAAFGALGPIVVIHLGTNGPVTDGQLDRLLNGLRDRRVILVTTHVPRPWQDLTNQRLFAAQARYDNVQIADWHALSSSHPDWFVSDGTHLRLNGVIAYTDMIRNAVAG